MAEQQVKEALNSKNFRYSPQALRLMAKLSDFDFEAFEKWLSQNMAVGSNMVMEFVMNQNE